MPTLLRRNPLGRGPSGPRLFAIFPKVSFFGMLNRWETVLAVLVLVVAINVGVFYFVYLPNRGSSPAAPPPEKTQRTTLTAPPENTTLKTTIESTTATATSTVSP